MYLHSKPSGPNFAAVTNQQLFYRKSSEWAYEREWRIIDSAFSADGEPTGPTGDCYPFRTFTTAAADREHYKLMFSEYPRIDWRDA